MRQGQITRLERALGVQSIQHSHAHAKGVPMITVCPDSALQYKLGVKVMCEHTQDPFRVREESLKPGTSLSGYSQWAH